LNGAIVPPSPLLLLSDSGNASLAWSTSPPPRDDFILKGFTPIVASSTLGSTLVALLAEAPGDDLEEAGCGLFFLPAAGLLLGVALPGGVVGSGKRPALEGGVAGLGGVAGGVRATGFVAAAGDGGIESPGVGGWES
tara:strand:- start:64 stop:474 length:411 start_codon:yes stop_codon:yes gene_type:complete